MNDYILVHHGVRGQKWGVRRYQNPDGSLTTRGKLKLMSGGKDFKNLHKSYKEYRRLDNEVTSEIAKYYSKIDKKKLKKDILDRMVEDKDNEITGYLSNGNIDAYFNHGKRDAFDASINKSLSDTGYEYFGKIQKKYSDLIAAHYKYGDDARKVIRKLKIKYNDGSFESEKLKKLGMNKTNKILKEFTEPEKNMKFQSDYRKNATDSITRKEFDDYYAKHTKRG